MPDGRVMRIDDDGQRAYIVRRGRSYEAPLAEIETAARVPSARVRFNLRRVNGIERAENVTLRRGTRTSKRQRRFGDLTGAHEPGAKVMTTAQATLGINVTTQPFRIVQAWIDAVSGQDFDAAVSLYSPSAAVHTSQGTLSGRRRLRSMVETCALAGERQDSVELHGVDRHVRADCNGGGATVTSFFTVENGRIIEQWLGPEPETAESDIDDAGAGVEVQVVTRGEVSPADVAHGRLQVEHAFRLLDQPVLMARLKLTSMTVASTGHSALAEVMVDVNGSLLRAHAAGTTVYEAIDAVHRRLESVIRRRGDRERHKPTNLEAEPGEWHHANLPSAHPPFFDRPREERELVRHKSFAPDELSVEEAAWDMTLLDYDFFLFVEVMTGTDCVLERTADGELVLQELAHEAGSGPAPIELLPEGVGRSGVTPPKLLGHEAIDFLDGTDERFLMFENEMTGRAYVIYRRYDGHYGLVTPPHDEKS